MIRLLLVALSMVAAPAAGYGLSLTDMCEPGRFKQTAVGLEIYCQAAGSPFLTVVPCAKPAVVNVRRSTICSGSKYVITCEPPAVTSTAAPDDDRVAVENDSAPWLVAEACAQPIW